jgi:MFS family permease
LSVAVVPLTKYFHKSSTEITYLLCFNTLMLGLGNLVWVPLMRTFGKRPVYLVAMFLFVMFNIWSYEAKSYRSLLAARMLSGLAASAGDAPVPAVVADLFFVHERGFCLMLCQIGLSFGFFLGPLINAYVVEDTRSWQWACGWLAIAGGVTWLIAIFALHETSYPHRQIDAPAETYGPKRGFWAQKAINMGYNKKASLFKTILDICEISLYPPVVWAGITTGVFVGW